MKRGHRLRCNADRQTEGKEKENLQISFIFVLSISMINIHCFIVKLFLSFFNRKLQTLSSVDRAFQIHLKYSLYLRNILNKFNPCDYNTDSVRTSVDFQMSQN